MPLVRCRRALPLAPLVALVALPGSAAASPRCLHFHRQAPVANSDQTICLDADAPSGSFRVSVQLPRGSFSQRISLALQHYARGRWVTDDAAGEDYETPVTSQGGRRHHQIQRASVSRISLPLDREELRGFSAQGVPVRLLGTSLTAGPGRTVTATATLRVQAGF